MAKIKNARFGEYMISCSAEGVIKVAKDFNNDKAALREIAEQIGFDFDTNWNTQQFGKKLIEHIIGEHVSTNDEASAECGEYVIFKAATGSIQVFKDYDNVKGALREIAEQMGFEYDTAWTTRQFGNKLIKHLNENLSNQC